jgi:hypothetical protein
VPAAQEIEVLELAAGGLQHMVLPQNSVLPEPQMQVPPLHVGVPPLHVAPVFSVPAALQVWGALALHDMGVPSVPTQESDVLSALHA